MNLIESIEPGIELISDYKENKVYRDQFNQLATLVFGINFEEWYQNGCWDDRYICYSFLREDKIIANVSISKMDLVIDGSLKKAIQIGTVMTHPDFRGRGLSGLLMKHVLDIYECECDILFLFANSSATDFYPKFGFTALPEYRFTLKNNAISKVDSPLRKLNCSEIEDLELIKSLLWARKPISEQFGISNNQGIFMFYALYVFSESIYYSPEDEAIVVFQQEDYTLNLYDIVSQVAVNLNDLLPRIANEQTDYIHFHFTPDQFTDNAQYELTDVNDDKLFVKANFALNKNSVFFAPLLAHA